MFPALDKMKNRNYWFNSRWKDECLSSPHQWWPCHCVSKKYRACSAANLNRTRWFDLVCSKWDWGSEKRNKVNVFAKVQRETLNVHWRKKNVLFKDISEKLSVLLQQNNIYAAKYNSKAWFALNCGWSVCLPNDLLFLLYRLWYQQDPGT